MPIHTSELDAFAQAVDKAGRNFGDSDLQSRYFPLELRYDTHVDTSQDPFSERYFEQQTALYKEIAARGLDQTSGELHPFDLERFVTSPNPAEDREASRVAERIRALSALLALAGLGHRPRVLDMGAGAGLSSEVYAYAGCEVHAVDIDPGFTDVSRRRAVERKFEVKRSTLNFDETPSIEGGPYQAAFFYQALHHALRPWALVADLAQKLDDTGVIGFTGEPMQSIWWPHWGLRLDPESIFVARRFGWFESGWSPAFIRECFERSGYTLLFFSGGYEASELGIAARDPNCLRQIRERATRMKLDELHVGGEVPCADYSTQTGVRDTWHGRPAFRQLTPEAGALMYGPYVDMAAGEFEFSLIVGCRSPQTTSRDEARLVLDVVADYGTQTVFREEITAKSVGIAGLLVVRRVRLARSMHKVEIRAVASGGAAWSVTVPSITRLAG